MHSEDTNQDDKSVGAESGAISANPLNPDEEANRNGWFWFKVKAFLVITAVIGAANYERWTESPRDRALRQQLMSDRMSSLAGNDAGEACEAEGGTSRRECEEARRRAEELARSKANWMHGQR